MTRDAENFHVACFCPNLKCGHWTTEDAAAVWATMGGRDSSFVCLVTEPIEAARDDGATIQVTTAWLCDELWQLAVACGCTSRFALYERVDAGDFAGTILESRVKGFRFLLEERP